MILVMTQLLQVELLYILTSDNLYKKKRSTACIGCHIYSYQNSLQAHGGVYALFQIFLYNYIVPKED